MSSLITLLVFRIDIVLCIHLRWPVYMFTSRKCVGLLWRNFGKRWIPSLGYWKGCWRRKESIYCRGGYSSGSLARWYGFQGNGFYVGDWSFFIKNFLKALLNVIISKLRTVPANFRSNIVLWSSWILKLELFKKIV